MDRKVIIIGGPTASGKTYLSYLLAKRLNSCIISADSRQVYKHLTIGTAKPPIEMLKEIKHYFVDELNPDESLNASDFEAGALSIIEKLFTEGKIPIVCGGSGLYIKALVDGITTSAQFDEDLRAELLQKRDELGNEYLFNELLKVDKEEAEKLGVNNWKRLLRALEVYKLSGKRISEHHEEYERNIDIEFYQYAIMREREELYNKINDRVDEMIENGLIEEVKKVLEMGYTKELNSLNTVGYKEIILFFEGSIPIEEAIRLIKRNTRRYAKKQMTWFRGDERVNWMSIDETNDFHILADRIIENTLKSK